MKTVKETAIHFKVNFRTVIRWIYANQIRATLVGRKWLISEEEIEYIDQNGLRPKN